MARGLTIAGQATVPSDWLGGYCCYSVLWPDSPEWEAILRGLLTLPSQGRYWDGNTGSIVDAQEAIFETFDNNLHLTEVLMACTDEVANGLIAIANALVNNSGNGPIVVNTGGVSNSVSCYSNSNAGVQSHVTLTDGTNWPIFGDGPIQTLPEEGFPPEYSDIEAYDADKCRKANKIADDLIDTLTNLGNVNFVSGVIGAVVILGAIVGLIAVPAAAIPLLLFALTANVGITAVVLELKNEVVTNRDDLVCLLYQGDNVENTLNSVSDFFDVLVATVAPEAALAVAVKSIALWLMSGDTLNALFSAQAMGVYPDATCECVSGCEEPIQITWEFPTDSNGWEWSQLVGSTALTDGTWYDPFNALTVFIRPGESGQPCVQRWTSPVGCYLGDTFEVGLSAAASPSGLVARSIVHYTDDTETNEIFTSSFNTLNTVYAVDIDPLKTIEWVAVEWEYDGISGSFDFQSYLNAPQIYDA